ncbi:HutD family protein [Shewanella litorisediminis]|uniref:HutD family protein n=1 Tax=Shewanella litorisediminis TaxID=1173586 RepID=A0ABX7G437_9GAMM|nr:HutD family protein [Shewanella litorisediminis]MCL2919462.1 HutD family protein [Shewanella litorisediminis]QRH01928.1 HutD family protein [Shewanella litorisediminis]
MPIHLVAAKDFVTNDWAGGSTTQLLIHPKGSSLAARDFEFRLSCARVEQSGQFSDFSGYDRLLLVLEGAMKLSSSALTEARIQHADSSAWAFDGGLNVHAELMATVVEDFNLFVPKGRLKSASRQQLAGQQRWHQAAETGASVYGVFLRHGQLSIGDTRLDSEHPLIISSTPLNLLAEVPSDLVAFAIGCRFPQP